LGDEPHIIENNNLIENVVFDHNVIVSQGYIGTPPHVVWTNNIFLNSDPDTTDQLFSSTNFYNAKYNCIWGFQYVGSINGGPGSRHLTFDEMDSSNVIADPRLIWEGVDAFLAEDSPCIDLGDPEYTIDPDGTRSDIGAHYFHHEASVPVDLPSAFDFQLSAFPNPFNSSTTISFGLDKSATTRLAIYDIQGKPVAEIDPPYPPCNSRGGLQSANLSSGGGLQSVNWDASRSPAGLYFCKVVAGGQIATTKVILVK
jgi:hypothetical protein